MQQVSIETAQSNLDCSILEKLSGKTIILGTLDLSDIAIETPETVAARIRRALPYVPAERIVVAPDCGLKYLPRHIAFGKMRAMVEGAEIGAARAEGEMRLLGSPTCSDKLQRRLCVPKTSAHATDGCLYRKIPSGLDWRHRISRHWFLSQ